MQIRRSILAVFAILAALPATAGASGQISAIPPVTCTFDPVYDLTYTHDEPATALTANWAGTYTGGLVAAGTCVGASGGGTIQDVSDNGTWVSAGLAHTLPGPVNTCGWDGHTDLHSLDGVAQLVLYPNGSGPDVLTVNYHVNDDGAVAIDGHGTSSAHRNSAVEIHGSGIAGARDSCPNRYFQIHSTIEIVYD